MKRLGLFSYALSVATIIAALSIAYYFVIALPKIQSDKQALDIQKFAFQKTEKEREEAKEEHYQTCLDEANEKAKQLLKNKIEIADKSGTTIPAIWREASEKGLFLKNDYDAYYEKCIQSYGLENK